MIVFLFGILGGCFLEFTKLYNLRTKATWPEYYKTSAYWIPKIFMILLGGFLSVLMCPSSVFANVYIGASIPVMIETLLENKYK